MDSAPGNNSRGGLIPLWVAGPDTTFLNINNFRLWVDKKGLFPWTVSSTGQSAGEYHPGLRAGPELPQSLQPRHD